MSARSRSIPIPAICRILNYVVVDDVGRVVNPMLVKGQVHGGVVQGVGQILFEDIRYDEDGQLAVRLVHGLCDAARRAFPALRLQGQRGADADEPARREGRRRGGDGRARWRR